MASGQILKIVHDGDPLRFGGTEEVVLHGVRAATELAKRRRLTAGQYQLISKRHLDRAIGTMDVPIVGSPLVGLVLLHQREELFGGPALGLPVIIVGR